MTDDFQAWLSAVSPHDEFDPGTRPEGFERVMREIFDRRGAISVEELDVEGRQIVMKLAREAVALVLRDLHATTDVRPNIEVSYDDEFGLIVDYNGTSTTTPVFIALEHPQAACDVADYLQDEIVEDVWTAWPTCPTHTNGLYAEISDGEASWYCRKGKHQVAAIGHLSA